MRKTILAIATSAALAGAVVTPTPAAAHCRGCIIGGALLGAAIASSRPVYAAPAPVYVDEPVYVRPGRCYVHEEVWSPRHRAYIVERVRVPCY